MANTLIIKKNNLISLSCSVTSPLNGSTVLAAMLINKVSTYMPVTIIDDTHFDIVIDTTDIPIGNFYFDIKVGNVSSETMSITVEKSIA